ncbi:MAG TPA: hypothetical protein VF172_01450 [Nitrososphaera sp.]
MDTSEQQLLCLRATVFHLLLVYYNGCKGLSEGQNPRSVECMILEALLTAGKGWNGGRTVLLGYVQSSNNYYQGMNIAFYSLIASFAVLSGLIWIVASKIDKSSSR